MCPSRSEVNSIVNVKSFHVLEETVWGLCHTEQFLTLVWMSFRRNASAKKGMSEHEYEGDLTLSFLELVAQGDATHTSINSSSRYPNIIATIKSSVKICGRVEMRENWMGRVMYVRSEAKGDQGSSESG